MEENKKHTVIIKMDKEFYELSKKISKSTQRPFSQYIIDALIEHNKKNLENK